MNRPRGGSLSERRTGLLSERRLHQLGYRAETVSVIGAIEALCLVLYLWPRTALLGSVLWVGYFGGVIATHVRGGSPLLTHTLFPLLMAAFLWAGLWLRNSHARRIMREAFTRPL